MPPSPSIFNLYVICFQYSGEPLNTFIYFKDNESLSALGPVHMIPGQLIAPGQLTDPGVNFASVHGLTSVTVDMSF